MTMLLQVSIVNGKELRVAAEEDWSVRCLKVSIERRIGCPPSRQRLVSSKGARLIDEEQLSRCPGVEQLTLVVLPKTNVELKRLHRWAAAMPQWQQRACAEILDNVEVEFENEQAGIKRRCPGKTGNAQIMESSIEVIAVVQDGPCQLGLVGNVVEFQFEFMEAKRATLDAVLAAVERAPALMLSSVDYEIALKVVQSLPNTYTHLPDQIRKSTYILDAALECDDRLRCDFMSSAGKGEIRQWQWRMQEEATPLRKRRAAKNMF